MHSKLFLHETAGSKQKCLIYNSSQFPPIIPVARKKTSHRLSPKFLPTQSSRQMAAPGIVCFGNRKPKHRGRTRAGTRPARIQVSRPRMPQALPAEGDLSTCDSKIGCLVPLGPLGLLI